MTLSFFISYRRSESGHLREFTAQLNSSIPSKGPVEYWYDRHENDGVIPGQDWRQRIRSQIKKCNVFCILVTPTWYESDVCKAEAKAAIAAGKPIVQVLVKKCGIPMPELSCVPNGGGWITLAPTEGERSALWWKAVEELRSIDYRSLQLAPTSQETGSPGPFEELSSVIDRLYTFKRLHDAAHQLYERYKAIPAQDASGLADETTRGLLGGGIKIALPEFESLGPAEAQRLELQDLGQVRMIARSLNECMASLEATPSDAIGRLLGTRVLALGAQLQFFLERFNECLVKSARQFDPPRFARTLSALQSQQGLGRQFSRLATEQRRLIKEHDALQSIQARLLARPAECFAVQPGWDDALDKWREVSRQVHDVVQITKGENSRSQRMTSGLRDGRQALRSRLERLDSAIAAVTAEATTINTLKCAYGDFREAFEKYFLLVDQELKAKYESMQQHMKWMVSQRTAANVVSADLTL